MCLLLSILVLVVLDARLVRVCLSVCVCVCVKEGGVQVSG